MVQPRGEYLHVLKNSFYPASPGNHISFIYHPPTHDSHISFANTNTSVRNAHT